MSFEIFLNIREITVLLFIDRYKKDGEGFFNIVILMFCVVLGRVS